MGKKNKKLKSQKNRPSYDFDPVKKESQNENQNQKDKNQNKDNENESNKLNTFQNPDLLVVEDIDRSENESKQRLNDGQKSEISGENSPQEQIYLNINKNDKNKKKLKKSRQSNSVQQTGQQVYPNINFNQGNLGDELQFPSQQRLSQINQQGGNSSSMKQGNNITFSQASNNFENLGRRDIQDFDKSQGGSPQDSRISQANKLITFQNVQEDSDDDHMNAFQNMINDMGAVPDEQKPQNLQPQQQQQQQQQPQNQQRKSQQQANKKSYENGDYTPRRQVNVQIKSQSQIPSADLTQSVQKDGSDTPSRRGFQKSNYNQQQNQKQDPEIIIENDSGILTQGSEGRFTQSDQKLIGSQKNVNFITNQNQGKKKLLKNKLSNQKNDESNLLDEQQLPSQISDKKNLSISRFDKDSIVSRNSKRESKYDLSSQQLLGTSNLSEIVLLDKQQKKSQKTYKKNDNFQVKIDEPFFDKEKNQHRKLESVLSDELKSGLNELDEMDTESEKEKQDLQNQEKEKTKKVKKPVEKYNYNQNFPILSKIALFCNIITRICRKTHLIGEKLGRKLDKRMQKKGQCQNKYFKLTAEILLFLVTFLFIALVYIIITSDSISKTNPGGFHYAKKYTAQRLIVGALLSCFYGIIFMQIQRYLWFYVLFILQVLPSIYCWVYYSYSHYLQGGEKLFNNNIIASSFAIGLYLFWFCCWIIREDMKKVSTNAIRNLFTIFWCLVPGAIIAGYAIYLTSTTMELNYHWGHQMVITLSGPYLLFLVVMWVYMHFRYFQPMVVWDKKKDPQSVEIGILKIQIHEEQQKLIKSQIAQMEEEQNFLLIENDDLEQSEQQGEKSKLTLSEKHQQLEIKKLNRQNLLQSNNENQGLLVQQQIRAKGENGEEILKNEFDDDEEIQLVNPKILDLQNKLAELQNDEQQEPQLSKEELQIENEKKRKQKLQNYLVIFTSLTLGSSMLILTILSLLYVANTTSMGEQKHYRNGGAFYMSIFMIIFMPFFIIVSTGVIFNKVSEKFKLILIPIFGTFLPMMFSLPLSLVIDYWVETRSLRLFFALGPAGICLWMICLIYVKINSLRLTMLLNSYICLFFIVPFLYILPLRSQDIWEENENDENTGKWIYYGLFLAGIGIIFLVFAIDLIKETILTWKLYYARKNQKNLKSDQYLATFISSQRFELSNIFRYDLQKFGLWGNAFGYILTFTILIYMYYNAPEWISDSQKGILLGIQLAILFLYFWCLIILLMRIISQKNKEAISFSQEIANMIENKHQKQVLIDRQKKVRWAVCRFAILENTVFCLAMMLIFWYQDLVKWHFIAAMIGIWISAVIFCWLYVSKRNFDDFSKTAIPAIVSFSWIFLYLPFSGIIPSSVMYLSEQDEKLVFYERMVFGGVALLLFTGVALVGLLVHLFFKRQEFERKLKFMSSKVIKKMSEIHVKCDYATINLAFQGYLSNSKENAVEKFKNGDPIYFIEISKYNPEVSFSKMILDQYTYDLLKNGRKKQKGKLKKVIDWIMYYYCCYRGLWCFNKNKKWNENDDDDGDKENLNLDDIDTLMYKANLEGMKKLEIVDDEDENPPFMKNYLNNQDVGGVYGDIIEALRRYDLPQNLQISTPWTNKFIKDLFNVFAQGSKKKFDAAWVDYSMFKQLMTLSHLSPSKQFEDYQIDKIYAKFTQYGKQGNQIPITEAKFTSLLRKIATMKYPFDTEDEALGKLIKLWLFPYLLWYVKPFHGFYQHEWDYVLFLLKYYGHKHHEENAISNDINFRRDLEKYLGINPGGKIEILDDPNKQKGFWEKFCDFLKLKLKEFCNNFLYYIKSHCLLDRDMQQQEKDDIEIEVSIINNTILRPLPLQNKRKKVFKHKESPVWDQVCKFMVGYMGEAETQYMDMKDRQFAYMRLRYRYTTIFGCIFKVIEFYILGSIAFTPNIDWGLSEDIQNYLNILNTLSTSLDYNSKYIYSYVALLIFWFCIYKATIRIKNGKWGSSEVRRRKKDLCSFDFLYQIVLNLISMVGSFYIMKTLLDAFSCDYSVVPSLLYQDYSVECFKDTHNSYFGLSIIGVMLLYPEFCYLWPHVQYQNRAQDLRYDSTYLSIAMNVKLWIALSAAFFANPEDSTYMLVTSAIVMFLFGTLSKKMKPCLVKKVNPLEMAGYYCAGWMMICGIICNYTEPLYGWIAMAVGIVLILGIAISLWIILNELGRNVRRTKKIKRIDENGEEVEDEIDWNTDDELEEEERKRKKEKEESLEMRVYKKFVEFKGEKNGKGEWLNEKKVAYKSSEYEVYDHEFEGIEKEKMSEERKKEKLQKLENEREELLKLEQQQNELINQNQGIEIQQGDLLQDDIEGNNQN